MTSLYVKSGAAGTADKLSWANAGVDLTAAASADVAGDVIYVSQAHAESTVGAIVLAFAGTAASHTRVIGANDAAEPPTTTSTTATVTGSSNLTITGCVNISGIAFKAGNGGSATQSLLLGAAASAHQTYEDGSLQLLTTGTGLAVIQLGDETRTDSTRMHLKRMTVRLGGTTHRIKVASELRWDGGSVVAGGVTPTSIFLPGVRGVGEFMVSNVDFSLFTAGVHLVERPASGNAMMLRFRNVIMPAAWTGTLWNAIPQQPGIRAEMYSCWTGTTKIRYWAWDFQGQVRDSTTVYRTGGFSDDGVPMSLKMSSSADSEYPVLGLDGPEIPLFVDDGVLRTLTLQVAHEAQGSGTAGALTDADFALVLTHPNGVVEYIKPVLGAATNIPTSAESWVGLTTPNKQVFTAAFTPTSSGEASLRPVLFLANKIVYVCPLVGG